MSKPHASSLEVVTFGETMALFIPTGHKDLEQASHYESTFAGAESNVAIGLARLGHRCGWFGHLGNDPFGSKILKGIRGEGVDVSQAKLSNEAPTGMMLKQWIRSKTSVYYYRKGSAASVMKSLQLDEEYIRQSRILHITGITAALSEASRETVFAAVEIARKYGVKVSFDPNLRLKLWSVEEARPVLLQLAALADYFLPGLDELKLLYETDDMQHIVEQLRKLNAACIVKGADESTLWIEREQITSVPYHPVKKVVDTVGAGDGFCAGFLSGILRGLSIVEAIRLGSVVGALVVQGVGDWESAPTWATVEEELQLRKSVER